MKTSVLIVDDNDDISSMLELVINGEADMAPALINAGRRLRGFKRLHEPRIRLSKTARGWNADGEYGPHEVFGAARILGWENPTR